MTAQVIHLPARVLADDIADKQLEVGQLEELEARQHAAWQQTAAELEHALKELAALEAQRGPLPPCGTCQTWHVPASEPCPPPSGCLDCGAEVGKFCKPDCGRYADEDWGDAG